MPIGALLPYCGTVAPTKFLLCDGSAVSRTTYATLYGIAGDLCIYTNQQHTIEVLE